jgi:uncharacterized damage-inducible protein DinB
MQQPPTTADEFTTLTEFLDHYRRVVVRKLEEVEEPGLRAVIVPSQLTTLGGIVQHLAHVERWWFHSVHGGRRIEAPWTEEDPDADFRVPDGATAASIIEFYERCCDESRRIVGESPELDRESTVGSRVVSLRWILVHMIEETARHAGHLDLLRESWDGATGD